MQSNMHMDISLPVNMDTHRIQFILWFNVDSGLQPIVQKQIWRYRGMILKVKYLGGFEFKIKPALGSGFRDYSRWILFMKKIWDRKSYATPFKVRGSLIMVSLHSLHGSRLIWLQSEGPGLQGKHPWPYGEPSWDPGWAFMVQCEAPYLYFESLQPKVEPPWFQKKCYLLWQFTAGAVSIATISEKRPGLKLKFLLSDTS